jgi:hypothetical protein
MHFWGPGSGSVLLWSVTSSIRQLIQVSCGFVKTYLLVVGFATGQPAEAEQLVHQVLTQPP